MQSINFWFVLTTDKSTVSDAVMGGDYRGTGDASPPKKKIAWGKRKRKRPPTIATLSKQKLDFFSILTTILYKLIVAYIPIYILYHKTFIPFPFHAEWDEYTILA